MLCLRCRLKLPDVARRILTPYRQRLKAGRLAAHRFSMCVDLCLAVQQVYARAIRLRDIPRRIDIDLKSKRHAHFAGENHIPESRLLGLDFDKITPFDFIRAVEKHRQTQKPLPELLGFEVSATK